MKIKLLISLGRMAQSQFLQVKVGLIFRDILGWYGLEITQSKVNSLRWKKYPKLNPINSTHAHLYL